VVDGTTWRRASEAGLDPERALADADSGSLLAALGALVGGPGRSNLLDLHMLSISPRRP
jgi:glycerate-2-kinase